MQMLAKPSLAMASAFLISTMMGDPINVNIGSMVISKATMDAVVVGAAALVSDVAGTYILPHIGQSGRLAHIESMILQPVLCGLATVGINDFFISGSIAHNGFLGTFLLGASSEVVGSYAYAGLFDEKLI